jgi:LCP family protein required for cell wall assembly
VFSSADTSSDRVAPMSRKRSPAVAALLSFLLPGLGQLYVGAVVRGLLWALPTVALLIGLVAVAGGGMSALIGLLADPATLIGLIVLNVAFLVYHVAAMLDAHALARRTGGWAGGAERGSQAVLAGLVVLALVLHGLPTVAGAWGNAALDRLFPSRPDVIPVVSFAPAPTDDEEPTDAPTASPASTASPAPSGTGGSASPSLPPSASPSSPPQSFPPLDTPWGDRLNVLLIGSDAGPGRTGGRTDTMIVLSVEIASGKAALFTFPRNKDNVPLPEDANGQLVSDRIFIDPHERLWPPGMLSSIWQRAYENPDRYYTPLDACPPGTPNLDECRAVARAYRATTAAIQNLAGVQLHGIISVNLNGFVDLVDAVDGVWIDVPYRVVDDRYPREDGTKIKIDIRPGCQKLDGTLALAFARSRHGAGENPDYQRIERQQLVLQAVRRQFDPLAVLPQLPHLLDVAADNLYTTFSREDLAKLAQVAARVDADRVYKFTFGNSEKYPMYLDEAEMRRIRRTVQTVFSQPEPTPTPKPSQSADCPPN